jgi:hypothetical protein
MLISFFNVKRSVHGVFVPPEHYGQLWPLLRCFRCSKENERQKKDRKFGATVTGSFITTKHQPTHPWKPQSLWLTTWLSFPILHYSPDLVPCDFTCFCKLKMKPKGECSEMRKQSRAVLNSMKGKWLPRCFWDVGKTMGSLNTFPRKLFWRRR